MIVERTQEGRAIAKPPPNIKEARARNFSEKQIGHAIKMKINHTYRQVEEFTGISKPTLYR